MFRHKGKGRTYFEGHNTWPHNNKDRYGNPVLYHCIYTDYYILCLIIPLKIPRKAYIRTVGHFGSAVGSTDELPRWSG